MHGLRFEEFNLVLGLMFRVRVQLLKGYRSGYCKQSMGLALQSSSR